MLVAAWCFRGGASAASIPTNCSDTAPAPGVRGSGARPPPGPSLCELGRGRWTADGKCFVKCDDVILVHVVHSVKLITQGSLSQLQKNESKLRRYVAHRDLRAGPSSAQFWALECSEHTRPLSSAGHCPRTLTGTPGRPGRAAGEGFGTRSLAAGGPNPGGLTGPGRAAGPIPAGGCQAVW